MPIIRNNYGEGNVQIHMGTGDIRIGSGMVGDNDRGLVIFDAQEPKPVGTFVKNENPELNLEDATVSIVFGSVASLDVLIDRLQTTRKYMTGELALIEED